MYKSEILEILEDIQHPAISYSLIKLGILTDINVQDKKVDAVFAFPFHKIPIADSLINSVKITLENFNYQFNYTTRLMSEEEKKMFLKLEHEAWKGL
jgi:metal-sulfur cluster biosynthetic enzyme